MRPLCFKIFLLVLCLNVSLIHCRKSHVFLQVLYSVKETGGGIPTLLILNKLDIDLMPKIKNRHTGKTVTHKYQLPYLASFYFSLFSP